MASHYEESMQRDIDRLRGRIAEMANLATDALEAVLRALSDRNRQLAYMVILRDRRIDELEMEIDRLCLEFLVRQQPVAKQLRFAYTAIKINQDIERIGDYAESIARQVLKLSALECDFPVARFQEIAALSIPMLRDAVRAFLTEDADLARRTMAIEDEVDGMKSAINADLFQLRHEDKLPLKALTPLMTVARRFERVTDQAQNICEEVIYMTTGEHSKHLGGEVWRVVFVDDDNACVSQMAEAIGHSLGLPVFVFASAGLTVGELDTGLLSFLAEKGIDVSRATTKALERLPNLEHTQILVALTPGARRAFSAVRKTVCLDWSGLTNPCSAEISGDAKEAAFTAAHDFLRQHISDLCQAVLADRIQ